MSLFTSPTEPFMKLAFDESVRNTGEWPPLRPPLSIAHSLLAIDVAAPNPQAGFHPPGEARVKSVAQATPALRETATVASLTQAVPACLAVALAKAGACAANTHTIDAAEWNRRPMIHVALDPFLAPVSE